MAPDMDKSDELRVAQTNALILHGVHDEGYKKPPKPSAKPALSVEANTALIRHRQIGMLEVIKRKAGPLVEMMPSANMRDRARKIYDLAKELQDDLAK